MTAPRARHDPSTRTPAEFWPSLRAWSGEYGRRFDWRSSRDPYRLLIAEVMLHRTRAPQVLPIYRRFVERFPDFQSVSQAPKDEVASLLYPLGLNWRIALVQRLVREIRVRDHGVVPSSKERLLELPGVSDYIAGAVVCFSQNKPEILLDTNIVRVIGRITGNEVTDGSRRSKRFRELVGAFLPEDEPRDFYFAILDLAASVCKQSSPRCGDCPVFSYCVYGRGSVSVTTNAHPLSPSDALAGRRVGT